MFVKKYSVIGEKSISDTNFFKAEQISIQNYFPYNLTENDIFYLKKSFHNVLKKLI